MIKSETIRNAFINFFKKNGHTQISSAPIVPDNDPSLLFTNAGMVQFKKWFTGEEKPQHLNVVSSQKCIRAGGKHNDLDNVGFTPRHHTFFEMLGNFSFGSYFKEKAILFAWEFLIKEMNLKKEKIYISIYNEDSESEKMWRKISGFSNSKIIKISSSDNFWSMGDTGPCGPCSEIFYDQGSELDGGLPGSKNQDGPRFIEIWNLVFMQFNKKNEKILNLPKKCVDTGMGLERITAVMNGKTNNFEIDIFKKIIGKISTITNTNITKDNVHNFRIIADHIRSIIFMISEGIIPSNEGRGYVLRRIIRRAAKQMNNLNLHNPLLYKLVDIICEEYKETFFELESAKPFIKNALYEEEKKFLVTLSEGSKLLEKEIRFCKKEIFPSAIIFKLYDTFGFPIDMTEQIISKKNFKVNNKELKKLFDNQKKISKKTWVGSGDKKNDEFLSKIADFCKTTKFVGYESVFLKSKLLKVIKNNKFLDNLENNEDCILIFEKTPFFAESGGQIGDSGYILENKDKIFQVISTQKNDSGVFLHYGKVLKEKKIFTEKKYDLLVNVDKRKKIRNNHSATHLLHESLRKIVGKYVSQKGSLVSEEKLRFDFTCNRVLTEIEEQNIEKLVNDVIRENYKVSVDMLPIKKALDSGAIGLFGEKYPDIVRVVTISKKKDPKETDFVSAELCGGTHVEYTGEIGSFKIISQSAVSSGVRRIEALTGEKLNEYLTNKIKLVEQIKQLLKTNEENIFEKIKNLKDENKSLKLDSKTTFDEIKIEKKNLEQLKKYKFFWQIISISPRELKAFSDKIKSVLDPDIFLIISKFESKISVLICVKESLTKFYNAVDLLKKILPMVGGKGGGGKNNIAQGGGVDSSRIEEIPKFMKSLIQ